MVTSALSGDYTLSNSPYIHTECLYNPSDRSWVVVPSFTWSVVTDLDLTVLALVFHGDALTEFGQPGTAAYVRGKWSF
jgi:hypothetical protein